MRTWSRRILAVGLVAAAAIGTGCQSWAKKSGYAMLPDEPFYTAAASGALVLFRLIQPVMPHIRNRSFP